MARQKFTIDFDMKNASAALIWAYISTPNGLSEWFADEVEQDDKTYTFHWNKTSQQAHVVALRAGIYIRLRWDDEKSSRDFFELRITQSELTSNRHLQITDFASDEAERQEETELWENQIADLQRLLGCF